MRQPPRSNEICTSELTQVRWPAILLTRKGVTVRILRTVAPRPDEVPSTGSGSRRGSVVYEKSALDAASCGHAGGSYFLCASVCAVPCTLRASDAGCCPPDASRGSVCRARAKRGSADVRGGPARAHLCAPRVLPNVSGGRYPHHLSHGRRDGEQPRPGDRHLQSYL